MRAFEPALDLGFSLVLEDGRRWGEAAFDFQRDTLERALDLASPPYGWDGRSRGSSKTTDGAVVAIAAMVAQLPEASRCYAIAADRDQGRLILDAVEGLVRRTPGLEHAFAIGAWRATYLRTGTTLDVLAADEASIWGLRPAFVFVDEIAQWGTTYGPRRVWEGISTSVAKIPGARMLVMTTAGDPAHWSYGILIHARSDPLWWAHHRRGPSPWMESARLEEQRRRLMESSFRRLFLNEWTEGEERLTTDEDLRSCVVLDGSQKPKSGLRYVIGVDVGLKNDRTAVVVAHAERLDPLWIEGRPRDQLRRVVLDRLAVWSGSRLRPVKLAEVEDYICEATRQYNRASVVFDPFQAVGMMQRLQAKGIRCEEFTFSSASVGHLATTLHLLLRNHALALPDDPELIEELASVRLRETSPGVFRMDHDPGRHDDRAIALALAAHHLLSKSATRRRIGQIHYDSRARQGHIVWGQSEEEERHYDSPEQRRTWNGILRMRKEVRMGRGR